MDRVWYKFYDKGVPYSIDYPGKPLKDYFNEWVSKNPDKPYLIWSDKELTYAEANTMAQKTANAILKLGNKGDRCLIHHLSNMHTEHALKPEPLFATTQC
jgi:long-chain acyl-CoA synthetase